MLKHARKRILVVDHLKFQRVAQCLVCPLSEVDTIITDDSAPDEMLAPFQTGTLQILRA
jgi:DeoR/GlpR family transcriptional regulator of sugar metabolism